MPGGTGAAGYGAVIRSKNSTDIPFIPGGWFEIFPDINHSGASSECIPCHICAASETGGLAIQKRWCSLGHSKSRVVSAWNTVVPRVRAHQRVGIHGTSIGISRGIGDEAYRGKNREELGNLVDTIFLLWRRFFVSQKGCDLVLVVHGDLGR